MNHSSKIAVILGFFFAIAIAEEKINLDDIERDNLRAESKSGSENVHTEETSYSSKAKPEMLKQKYQQETHLYRNNEEITGYAGHQQLRDKYNIRPEDYQQDVKYLTNNVEYQQTPQPIEYSDYQQQVETAVPKSISQAENYETPQQQLYYQPEVSVGNHYQSVQQKTASEKFVKNSNKETLYVNIPMTQLLSYYPNIEFDQSSITKSQVQPLFHRLATNQQIAIPIYMPPFNRDPIYANSKITYQIQPQYATSQQSRYPLLTEAILPTRSPSKLIYPQGPLSHRQSQPQTHYLQEIVYTQQPGALTYVPSSVSSSSHDTSSYDLSSSSHSESNVPSQNYASQSRHEQSYAPQDHRSITSYAISTENYSPRLTNQIYQQHSAENVQQDYDNIPDAPDSKIDLPRLPAQNFKNTGNNRLLQITRDKDNSHYAHNRLIHSSEPRSLLDSYVPSNLLAAQNSERYRERPIKLERGFLPSKINFVNSYKKRKVD